jgi:hypothetical protein
MEHEERQHLVEQRATNGQTLQFIADRLAEMADQADQLARKEPGWAAMANAERAHRDTLMEAAAEEKRLATAINLEAETARAIAATERELRKDLLEIAREQNHTAANLMARESDDPIVAVLAEQAERNRQLLRYVAHTATEAARALREDGQR